MSSFFYQKSETPCIIFHLPFTGDLTAISADVVNTIKRVLHTKYMVCIEDSDTETRYWLNLVGGEIVLRSGKSGEISSSDIEYDNTDSGLTADDVQDAIDEVNAKFGDITASDVEYDNTDSGLTADDVQDAIDEVNGKFGDIDASDISYDNTDSGLTADDVQDAIDEVDEKATNAINKWSFPVLHVTRENDNDKIISGEEVVAIISANSPFIIYCGSGLDDPNDGYILSREYSGRYVFGGNPGYVDIEIEPTSIITLIEGTREEVYQYDETTGNYIMDASNS